MTTLNLELPEAAFFELRKSPEEFVAQMRLAGRDL
jgi:hypothetical protein